MKVQTLVDLPQRQKITTQSLKKFTEALIGKILPWGDYDAQFA